MIEDVQKFRKKPVEVEAIQLRISNVDWIAVWCGGIEVEDVVAVDVPTLEGIMRASDGDWVIKGIKGEFYPCKPDIFEASYEKVS